MARHHLSAALLALSLQLPYLTLGLPRAASAEEISQEEAEYEKGLTYFKAGDYERAVLSFMSVYRIAPNPNLVYNIARSFEELKRFNEAADFYTEYLKLKPNASDRAQIEITIKTLRSLAQSQPSTASKSAASGSNTGASGRDVLMWSAIGVGGALLATGVWSGLKASDAAERRDAATSASAYQSAQDEMSSAAGRADLLYLGGALFMGAGVTLWLMSGSSEPATAAAPLTLSASPRHVALRWTF
jgi:tetratricopeptide (TPR) repeat protein